MNFIKRAVFPLAFLLPFFVLAYANPGKPSGYVNDFAGILNAEQKNYLEKVLAENDLATTNEIVLVTIKNLGDDTIENFAVNLFEDWNIGKKGKNNGALLLVSVEDRQMRIEVGYGLEPVLTDAQSGQIIRNVVAPKFKEGDYYGGISDGLNKIILATKGEFVSSEPAKSAWRGNLELYMILFWLGFGILEWFFAVMARSKSWWLGGIIGGVIGLIVFFFTTIFVGLIVSAILVPLGLLLDYIISREYAASRAAGRKPHWWAGGPGFFGGGRGPGGFGGFGGGMSGGGGASGRW